MESKMAVRIFKYYRYFPNTYTFETFVDSDFNASLTKFYSSEY